MSCPTTTLSPSFTCSQHCRYVEHWRKEGVTAGQEAVNYAQNL